MGKTRRRIWSGVTLVAAFALVTVVVTSCSATASGETGGAGASRAATAQAPGTSAGRGGGANSDWTRVAAALAWMRAYPPTEPVVVLLGGSAARESTDTDASWRAQIRSDGGPATLSWNMGSHNRTMAQNLAIVKKLPKGIHALVLVGINLGLFTSPQKTASISLPSPAPSTQPSLKQPHQYGVKKTGILSVAKKQAMVRQWIGKRYPVYTAHFKNNASLLEQLIKLCKERGYKPVLYELPRNTTIIGGSLNAPTARFRATCAALHKKYGVPWISLVAKARIPNQDFYDIWHLVEPGRTIWQRLLSAETATLLKQYGYAGGS